MHKARMSLCALSAAIAWISFIAADASATLWLKNGASITTATAASIHGTVIMRHEGGVLGSTYLECSGLTVGTVGPGAENHGTLLESLTGEKDLSRCHVVQGFCSETIDHPLNLPWNG